MNLDLSLVNILILFGAVQGFTLAVVLFASRRHPGASYLGLAVLALVYNGLETFNWSSSLEKYTAFFDYYPFVLIFLVGPSFYLYQHSLLSEGPPLSRKRELLAYSPFLFQFSYLTICWTAYHLTKAEIINFQPGLRMAGEFYGWYSEPLSVLVYLFFTAMSVRHFIQYSKLSGSDKKSPTTRKVALSWAKQLLTFQLLLALIWLPTVLISYSGAWPFSWSEYYPVEIFLVLFLYWIAIAGYFKIKAISVSSEPDRKTTPIELGERASERALLQALMQEKQAYRDRELSVASVSEKTGLAPKTVSKVLNQAAGVNFNDFVNSYRVEAFCRELENKENAKLTLQGIAFICGFNSPATFQRTFKKFKGVTPGAYFQRIQEMGESGR